MYFEPHDCLGDPQSQDFWYLLLEIPKLSIAESFDYTPRALLNKQLDTSPLDDATGLDVTLDNLVQQMSLK